MAGKLETVKEKIPSWVDTVNLMSQISSLIDMALYTVDTTSMDALIKQAIGALEQKFGVVLTSIE